MLRRFSVWGAAAGILLLLAIGAAACDDDDDDDDGAATATATGTSAATATATEDGGGATELTAAVASEDGSITGTVTLSVDGEGTVIDVSLEGLPEGAHANHIHHGSCAAQGEVHVPLTELTAAADGAASGTTPVSDLPLDHFATGHYYAVHTGGDDVVGDVIACGDVVAS